MRAPGKNGGRPAGRGRPWPRGIVIGTGLALLAGVLAVAAPAAAGTSQHGSSGHGVSSHRAGSRGARPAAGVKPGKWLVLGSSQTSPPVLWRAPGNRDWAVWSPAAPSGAYRLALIAPDGGFAAKPKTIISGWSGVTSDPTLLAHGNVPLLVFSGQDNVTGPLSEGCVVGALPASPRWKIQSWSLSQDCTLANVGYGDAAQSGTGVLSAAWAAGAGVQYHLGTSPAIPASSPDQQISLAGHAQSVAETDDRAGNGHAYAAYERFFSAKGSQDGVYVKDITGNGPVLKAPKSGTESVNFPAQPQRVAMASPLGHAGIYLAYCANPGTCKNTVLWKAGSKKTITVPHGGQAIGLAMSAGPAGRLWLAWYDEQSNRVYVARTNKADTRFGPLESYRAPCFADGNTHLALTGGSFGRADVGLECLSAGAAKPTQYLTQSLAGLTIRARPSTIRNTRAVRVTFVVTDAGDPVKGAKVKVNGHTLITGKNGACSLTFRKHARPGAYRATAALASYYGASVTVHVKS